MDITVKEFSNPLNHEIEELVILPLSGENELKYICKHSGQETIVLIDDQGNWIENTGLTTELSTALGDVIEHHFA